MESAAEHQSNLPIYERRNSCRPGSGGGIDVFLSANKVRKTGKVIGIDMTDEMLERAEEMQRRAATPMSTLEKET